MDNRSELAALLRAVNDFEGTLDAAEGEELLGLSEPPPNAASGEATDEGPCPICGQPLEDGHTHDGER